MHRVLIVSTTFYPHPVVGAVRMTQFARHLPEFGWEPTVLCRDYGYRAPADQMAKATHPCVRVRYIDGRNADAGAKGDAEPPIKPKREVRAGSLRRLLAGWAKIALVPDVSVLHWKRARPQIEAAIDELKPSALITTGPPHGNHIVGLLLSQTHPDLPWVADFRDPFTIDPRWRPTGLARLRWPAFRRFEQRIYERAAMIVHNIEVEHRWATRQFTFAADRMMFLPNGCPADLAEGRIDPIRSEGGRRSIRLVGTSGSDESLMLARAVADLVKQGHNLEMRFVGPQPDSAEEIVKLLGGRAVHTGRVPHEQALGQIAGADVLACVLGAEKSKSIGLSSKLYEFLSVGVPLIVVNPTFPDRLFLNHLRDGVRMLQKPGPAELVDAVKWSLSEEARQSGHILRAFGAQFNRRTQVHALAHRLDALAQTRSGSRGAAADGAASAGARRVPGANFV